MEEEADSAEDSILMEEEGEVETHSATRLLQRMIFGAGARRLEIVKSLHMMLK